MNTSVKFELAKVLKEKGFDNETTHYYNEKGEMLFDIYFPSLQPSKPDIYYDNPTIAEVVMWLYEKHKIYIWVAGYKRANNRTYFDYYFSISKLNDKSSNFFNSPTEAYEAAIEYVINNLIK